MIARARETHPALAAEGRFVVADAREYAPGTHDGESGVPGGRFDAVFSNAMLHWVPETDQDAVLGTVRDALQPGGRFVAEFGGRGNVASIVDAVGAAAAARGYEPATSTPWYFPSVGDYAPRLEAHGLEVRRAVLFDRPTELDGGDAGLREWLDGFGDRLLASVPAGERAAVVAAAEERLRPALIDEATGSWVADYRRLRVAAVRDGERDG
jgi:SAM-dependent methyltransferase